MCGEAGTVLYRGMCAERWGRYYIEACVRRGRDGLILRPVCGEVGTVLYRGMCAERRRLSYIEACVGTGGGGLI